MRHLILVALTAATAQVFANPFANVRPNAPVCFGREYSTAHMNAHPNQTVRQMKVKASKEEWSGQSGLVLTINAEVKREVKPREGEPYTIFKPYGTVMTCAARADRLQCGIDCDGGSATVTWNVRQTGNELRFVNRGFIMYGGCGDDTDDYIFLNALKGGDDIFRLFPLPATYCQQ